MDLHAVCHTRLLHILYLSAHFFVQHTFGMAFDFISSFVADKFFTDFNFIWRCMWHHFSEKSQRMASTRKTPYMKRVTIDISGASHRDRLACALLRQKQVGHKLQECSRSVSFQKVLFDFVFIAQLKNSCSKVQADTYQMRIAHDLTTSWAKASRVLANRKIRKH